MKKLFFSFSIIILSFSCENKSDVLYQQIWEAHDEVMPKMSDLRLLTDQIEEIPDSIKINNDSLMIIHADLKSADAWMMKWMREFDSERKNDEVYLTSELEKVNEMKTYFENKLEDGKVFMANRNK